MKKDFGQIFRRKLHKINFNYEISPSETRKDAQHEQNLAKISWPTLPRGAGWDPPRPSGVGTVPSHTAPPSQLSVMELILGESTVQFEQRDLLFSFCYVVSNLFCTGMLSFIPSWGPVKETTD